MTVAQKLYEDVVSRGGRFTLSGSRVRVTGVTLSVEQLLALKEHERALEQVIYQAQAAAATAPTQVDEELLPRDYEAVMAKIAEWKRAYTQSKGYEWCEEPGRTPPWKASLALDRLGTAVRDYVGGTGSLASLRTAFIECAEAHRVTGYVLVGGRQVQTVTPQVHPSLKDFARAALLFGYGKQVDEFAKAVQRGGM